MCLGCHSSFCCGGASEGWVIVLNEGMRQMRCVHSNMRFFNSHLCCLEVKTVMAMVVRGMMCNC